VNRSPEARAPALLLVIRFYERRLLLARERARAYLNRIPDFKRLFDARGRISTSSYLFDAKHRFDNHLSLINLRIESEFLTTLKSPQQAGSYAFRTTYILPLHTNVDNVYTFLGSGNRMIFITVTWIEC
jgi:hypothetical protein